MAATTAESSNEFVPGVKKITWTSIVKAVAIVSLIVLVEIVLISMLLPSSEDTKLVAERLVAASSPDESAGDQLSALGGQQTSLPARGDVREVDLGSYHVVTYNPDTGSSMNVDFDLYGTVLASDESQFLRLYETNKIRIREQILLTVRGTEVADLSDAQLGLLKRQILEKTNRALGKPLLHEAVFSKFSFIER